ncbi:MAG: flagellin [Bryobacteraceae bacterium]|jgi:flagellar hook-associated protein 3 FlgL
MISPLSASSQSFLVGLDQIEQREQQAQTELTTGLKINVVSDAPDEISTLLQTRADLSQAQQINSNLGIVTTEANTAQTALQNAVSLVDQAQSLGTQGASDLASSDTQQNVADQLGTVLQNLVGLANTTVGGRYIFSGDDDQQAPYSIDLTQSSPISPYQGSPATRQIQASDGSQFAVSLDAQTIFDSPDATQNVFTSINNLRQALLSNSGASAVTSALADVQTADTYLNQQLAFYGNVQDEVSSASNDAQNNITNLQTQLSGIQDADEAAAITQLTEGQTAQQAALVSRSQLPKTSLFDYLSTS